MCLRVLGYMSYWPVNIQVIFANQTFYWPFIIIYRITQQIFMEDMKTASMSKMLIVQKSQHVFWWPKTHEILTQDSKFNRKERVMPQSVTGNKQSVT